MEREQAVLEAFDRFINAGLIKCDGEEAANCVTKDILGIGMGDQGVVASRKDVIAVIAEGVREEHQEIRYVITREKTDFRWLSPEIPHVCATVRIDCTDKNGSSCSRIMQSLTFRQEDGEWKICALHASPLIVSKESVDAYPLKFAESTLAQLRAELQNETFDLINQSVPGGVVGCYLKPGFPIYFINDQMLSHLGHTRVSFMEETQGAFSACIHPDDSARVRAGMEEALRCGDEFEMQFRIIKRDKSVIWMVERGRRRVDDSGKDIMISVFVDVTQIVSLKDALEEKAYALEAKNRELKSLTDNVAGGVCTMQMDGKLSILYANSFFYEMHGYTQEQMCSELQNQWIHCVYADDVERVINTLLLACTNQRSNFEFETQVVKRGGDIVWVLVRGSFLQAQDGINVHCVILDITERKQMELALKLSEERFRIALDKTSSIIFEYDVQRGIITHSRTPKKDIGTISNVSDAPESLILGGTVLPEHSGAIFDAFREIREGSAQTECVVKTLLANGSETWNKITMTGIMDDSGKAVRAIGMVEDITRQKETELAYIREEQYRQAFLADALASYVVNFTKDEFESSNVLSPYCVMPPISAPYDSYLREVTQEHLSAEDRRAFLTMFSRSRVLEAFEKNEMELKLEYRNIQPDGSSLWMMTTMRLVLDAISNDMKGFLYVLDIDARKREEERLTYKSERDTLTGLFNKGASELHIKERLTTSGAACTGVFMIIDIDYFKRINDVHGHPYGDEVLRNVAHGIRDCFRQDDIVGRLGGDEFVVFFCGIRSSRRIAESAREICEVFATLYPPDEGEDEEGEGVGGVTCSIGISVCDNKERSFEELYREADKALYQVKAQGRNGYAFYQTLDMK